MLQTDLTLFLSLVVSFSSIFLSFTLLSLYPVAVLHLYSGSAMGVRPLYILLCLRTFLLGQVRTNTSETKGNAEKSV